MMKSEANRRNYYQHFQVIGTGWMDNDVYGDVNSVAYFNPDQR
jgi:hypothetical protein